MESVEFSIAQQTDAAAIARVHIRTWQTAYATLLSKEYLEALNETQRYQWWLQILATPNHGVFVVKIKQEVVGFISVGPAEGHSGSAEVYAFYILEEAQRSGYGNALWQMARQWLSKQGYQSLVLWVLKENPSVAFYIKQGGQQQHIKPVTIGGTTLDEVCYAFQLTK
ncbi:MAG: GNAT family N-acetyltransferase [Chitinophagales bacterium]